MTIRSAASILIAGVFAHAVFSAPLAQAADTLTLDQAVLMALENNRSLQHSAIEVEKAQDQLAATRTRQFPSMSVYVLGAQQLRSVDLTLEKGVLGTYEGTGPLPDNDVHLTTPLAPTGSIVGKISQPITSLIRIRRNMDTQRTGVKLAQEETRGERQKLTRQVKQLYYSLQTVGSSLRAVRETQKLYEEVEKLTDNYVIQQVALRGDLMETQTRVARNTQLELSLVNQQASAREQLNQLLGRDVTTDFEVQPVLEATGFEPNLQEARGRALRERPEIKQAMLRQ